MTPATEMKTTAHFGQADATHLPLADKSVDLVFCSPPYVDARTYGIGAQRHCVAWVEWMLGVVTELTRVCRGLVLVNCAGVTRQRVYQPAPEGLAWEWYRRGGNLWRPAYWHRVGIPGSGGKHWLRADVEYVLCFKADAEWPTWSENTACGHIPKWAPGGEMSHRLGNRARTQWGGTEKSGGHSSKNGEKVSFVRPSHVLHTNADVRVNTHYKRHSKSRADGTDEIQIYIPPVKANPGNLLRTTVGGGQLGHPLAHKNEAPFPEKLAEFFIKSFCPPGGIVVDTFSGSGTTACTAQRLGRVGIGFDLRMNQCQLGRQRFENPVVRKAKKVRAPVVGLDERMLFELISA